ncbi:maleylpyruvate isomerase family mycothiol-dependent enzyme [Microbacterium sp. SSM24]|uniref:maleylpyruvate isomerase family mycothiol-dependent enzyme n=1 Tax=Microbacterium sp. SSM24 TaxID=2991714 RepID=UPI0022279E7D|nr:maleylpyruvate isomerase family mycothiol-dependent enzyme [Microbacterium sp. SSM24]MCW3492670.1 maleylpyruvate isomerase family mycothiol-dependent enzyme [Microbacterium sp. SSM24]
MPARTDNVTDPQLAASLLLMRRGQAVWARQLAELPDDRFDEPSLLPGWTRRHLVAHVGFNARAVARLVEWARTGVENPMYSSDTQRAEEIAFGATLPVEALRHLAAHAAVHLDVEWRDLPEAAWLHQVRTAQGRLVPATETVWMRTREVWIHAVDLRNGASVRDFPDVLHDLLLADLIKVWTRKRTATTPDIILAPTDRAETFSLLSEGGAAASEPLVIVGSAADVVGWGIGRSMRGVATASGGEPPRPPDWL